MPTPLPEWLRDRPAPAPEPDPEPWSAVPQLPTPEEELARFGYVPLEPYPGARHKP